MRQHFVLSNDRKINLRNTLLLLIIILVLAYSSHTVNAQTSYSFEANTKFDIPEYNSSVSFSTNGTYEQGVLESGVWQFRNLQLNNSQNLENLQVSTLNANITITSYRQTNTTSGSARLRYVTESQGTQTFNFGPMQRHGKWSVVVNGAFLSENNGWTVTGDDKLTITGAAGSISITYYYYPPSYENSLTQPIYQSHSVIIVTTVAVVVMVILAILINFKREKTNPSRIQV